MQSEKIIKFEGGGLIHGNTQDLSGKFDLADDTFIEVLEPLVVV